MVRACAAFLARTFEQALPVWCAAEQVFLSRGRAWFGARPPHGPQDRLGLLGRTLARELPDLLPDLVQ
jgi:hypothetical protein